MGLAVRAGADGRRDGPPFQVPDEPEHVAYVKVLAEAGRLPTRAGSFSLEEVAALVDLRLQTVAQEPENKPISSRAQQETLQHDLEVYKGSTKGGAEYAGVAASQPPLYYALQAVPFSLGAGGTLLDRIELMRLLSALTGAIVMLFLGTTSSASCRRSRCSSGRCGVGDTMPSSAR